MSGEEARFIEFKALGTNCVDCGFTLLGRTHTVGAEICSKIEREFRDGTLDIDIEDDKIIFIIEGVAIVFSERPERLSAIKQMLESGSHVRYQSYEDANSSGFALTAGD